MAPILLSFPFLLFLLLPSPSLGEPCTARRFSKNRVFSACLDLPHLSASLHYTFDPSNATLALGFAAPSGGWIAWGIGESMVGAQSLIAFRRPDGTVGANTFNITAYGPVKPSPIAFETWGLEAEAAEKEGMMGVFATVKLPPGTRRLNQVWQVGPMGPGESIGKHGFGPENLQTVGVLDMVSGKSSGSVHAASGLNQKNIHGLLNAVGWGILLPIGGMAARWLKKFNPESPAWFYIHVPCQLIGYAAGLAGGATGLKLGSESEGITYTTHRDIAIALICIGVLQVSALFLRPDKSHKYRKYWNAYHHLGGYAVIVLGVINVLKGLQILNPDRRFVMAYVVIISILAIVSVLLEISSWIFVGMSKNSRKTADGTGVAVEQSAYQHHEPLAA